MVLGVLDSGNRTWCVTHSEHLQHLLAGVRVWGSGSGKWGLGRGVGGSR